MRKMSKQIYVHYYNETKEIVEAERACLSIGT
jgi:hypothetical protein